MPPPTTRDASDRDYWDRHAKHYDRSMVLLGGPIPRMAALAADAVRGSRRVLEVAAGTGLVTTSLGRAAQEVIATDYAAAMVATLESRVKAEGLTNVRCEQADVYALRFERGSFDAVVAANVLHLVPDLEGALAALVRVLEPGGRLVVPTYCHDQTMPSRALSRLLAVTGFPGHRRFTVQKLRTAVERSRIHATHVEVLPGLIPIGYVDGTTPR
jgi:phosphatidylethanolamine/phosphatidyl-N-methylethanolamine N-methyltransferase